MLATLLGDLHPLLGFAGVLALCGLAVLVTGTPAVVDAASDMKPVGARQIARGARQLDRPLVSVLRQGRGRILAFAGIGGLVTVLGLGSVGLLAVDSRMRSTQADLAERARLQGQIQAKEDETQALLNRHEEELARQQSAHRDEVLELEARYQAREQALRDAHAAEIEQLRLQFMEDQAQQGETDALKNTLKSVESQLMEQRLRTLQLELDQARQMIREQQRQIEDLDRSGSQ